MIENTILFYPCVNYLPNRVVSAGRIVRELSDNDYATFATSRNYVVDIRRNGGPTKVNFVFVKCKGVTSYRINNTPPIDRTLPASVENQIGREVPTTRFGFQHDLFEIVPTLHQSEIDITFTGSDVRIYELMFLETGYQFDIDARFDRETHTKIDRTGILHEDTAGGLERTRTRGSGRWAWKSDYNILFPADDYDTFLFWLENNPNVFFSQGFTNTPNRIYPAAVTKSTYEAVGRSDVKSEGSYVAFTIEEHIGKAETQVTSQNNDPPIVPLPLAVRDLSADVSVFGKITLSWRAPANAMESALTRYEYREQGDSDWVNNQAMTTATLTDIRSRVYTLEVRPVGASGAGPVSRITVTAREIPVLGSVRSLTVTSPDYNAVRIAFIGAANEVDANVSYYEWRQADGAWTRIQLRSDDRYVVNLTEVTGGAYTYEVRGRGSRGNGAISTETVTVRDHPLPTVVTTLSVRTSGYNEVTISFGMPTNAVDAEIAEYQYRKGTEDWVSLGTDRSRVLTGVDAGEHTYQVRARGTSGFGAVATADAITVLDRPLPTVVRSLRVDAPGNNNIRFQFSVPSNREDAAVANYEWKFDTETDDDWRPFGDGTSSNKSYTTTTAIIVGTYTVEIRAVGASGAGPAKSKVVTVTTTLPTPTAVTRLTATASDLNEVTLSFDAPANAAASLPQKYQYRRTGVSAWTDGTTATTIVITSVAAGTYTYQVRAVGLAGAGTSATSNSVRVLDAPLPTAVRTVSISSPDYNQVVLAWTRHANAEAAGTVRYEYRLVGTTAWQNAGTALTVTLEGVTAGSRSYEIRAVGTSGAGPSVTTSAVTVENPPPLPGVVRSLTADTSVYYQITFRFTAPSNATAAEVSGYEYRTVGAEDWTDIGTNRSFTITGLRNVQVAYEVRAVGTSGTGPAVSVTATARIRPVAAVPTLADLVLTETGFTIDISAPTNAVAADITHYEYRKSTDFETDGTTPRWTRGPDAPTDKTEGITDYAIVVADAGTYSYTFRAVGQEGAGAISTSLSVVIPALPIAPMVSVDVATAGQATLTLSPPSNAAATGVGRRYRWRRVTDPVSSWTEITFAADAALSVTDAHSDLAGGGSFAWQVQAYGTRGWGATGTGMGTVRAAGPQAPVIYAATLAFAGNVAFRWRAPSDATTGGYTLVRYEYKLSHQSDWTAHTNLTNLFTFVQTTTHQVFQVRAVGNYGDGDIRNGNIAAYTWTGVNWSLNGQNYEYTGPGPSRNSIYSAERDVVSVSWQAPENDGGAPIIDYLVTGSGINEVVTTPDITFTTLYRGVGSNIVIRARNAVGYGDVFIIRLDIPNNEPAKVTGTSVASHSSGDGVIVSWDSTFDYGGVRDTEGDLITTRIYDYKLWTGTTEPATWQDYDPDDTDNQYQLHIANASLQNNQSHRFKIRATNSVGDGPDSDVLTFRYPLS